MDLCNCNTRRPLVEWIPFLTLSPFPPLFSVICDPRRRPVPLAVECVQYVDLLLCATAKSSPAAAHCGRQRRSGPFNNPLSHFCVSEEGRERDDCRARAPCGRWRERETARDPSFLGNGRELRRCLERSSENRGTTGSECE